MVGRLDVVCRRTAEGLIKGLVELKPELAICDDPSRFHSEGDFFRDLHDQYIITVSALVELITYRKVSSFTSMSTSSTPSSWSVSSWS